MLRIHTYSGVKIILAFNYMFMKGVTLYYKCCEKSSLFNYFCTFIHLQVVPNGVDFRIPFLRMIVYFEKHVNTLST